VAFATTPVNHIQIIHILASGKKKKGKRKKTSLAIHP